MSSTDQSANAELNARLAQLSPERRALLERKLRELGGAAPATERETVPHRGESGPVPLTPGQELLWALDQAVPDVVAYNVPRVLRVTGVLDPEALQGALDAIVARHEVLRTRFVTTPDGPRQVIDPPSRVALEQIDLRGEPEATRLARAEHVVVDRIRRHFDLARDLMLRATLVRTGSGEYTVLLLSHHIVCDEWSRDVTFRELGAFYDAIVTAFEPALAPLPIQYADYAVWQRDAMERGALVPQLAYWRKQLTALTTLDLPTDRPRSSVPSFAGARRRLVLSRDLLDDVRALARANDVTLNMALLAAYNVVLARHSGQTDIVVGSPVSSRRYVELEGLIGYFPNAVVLRTRLDDDPSFGELLRRTREVCLAAYEHQDVPLEKLALELREAGELGHDPLFNVWFVMQAESSIPLQLTGATVEPLVTDFATAKFDILLGAIEKEDGLHLVLEYRTELFDAESIDRFGAHLRAVLEGAVAQPQTAVSALPILPADERALVVSDWNATSVDYPRDETLVSLLSSQAERTPNALAVKDDTQSLTYAELDRASTALARQVRDAGGVRGTLVGVSAERSVEMVIALVAILKAGAAYVPLDPNYPANRLAYMVEDAGVAVLLTTRPLSATITTGAASVLLLEGAAALSSVADDPPLDPPLPEDLAYMIYTSGSTGRPKGALNAHSGIVNRLHWMQSEYSLGSSDSVLQKTPFSFDVSVWEFFWPLITGATLVMARPGGHRDSGYLADVIQANGITVCHFVPSMLRAFLADPAAGGCTTLRDVMASGEALRPDLVAAFASTLASARLHNLYGPTECAVDVSYWPCPRQTAGLSVVPIGRPVANTQLYVLDSRLQPLPIGVPGELYLGGVQVGRGYHNRPELTAERFVADPFSRDVAARLYRTGDRARWLANGTVEYLGRLDFQVKVRGFRIELGEIESALLQHVQDATVIAHDDGSGDTRLIGFIVPRAKDVAASEGETVERWTEVFDRTYSHAEETGDAVESGFNIAGWVSSYDKRPIPASEMREWVERACERILALRPRRILEIGCGTGLLLFRIAPHVERFHGVDIAATALDGIRRDPAFAAIADRVTLAEGRADEIDVLGAESFDVIVINSVVQYFPSVEYLVQVLERAVRLVAPGGAIFVGDVRLLPLLETLHASVVAHDAADDVSITDLRARVQQLMWNESELVIDPSFFEALRLHLPQIAEATVLLKRGSSANELTKFRGDVVLRVGSAHLQAPPEATPATPIRSLDDVRRLLSRRPAVLQLKDLVNARTAQDIRMVELLRAAPAQGTVRELRASLDAAAMSGIDPESLVGVDSAYDVAITWPASNVVGRFDVVFRSKECAPLVSDAPSPAVGVPHPWSDFVHHPAPQALTLAQVASLRMHLASILPDYMIPAAYVQLESMPLTPSGKVDRKALRPPTLERASQRYQAPRTETEAAVADMWAEVLRIERVGIEDGFLDLGGHSLVAMRIVGRVRREMGVRVGLESLVRGETVAQFAALIDASRASPAVPDDEVALAPISRDAFRRSQSAPAGSGS